MKTNKLLQWGLIGLLIFTFSFSIIFPLLLSKFYDWQIQGQAVVLDEKKTNLFYQNRQSSISAKDIMLCWAHSEVDVHMSVSIENLATQDATLFSNSEMAFLDNIQQNVAACVSGGFSSFTESLIQKSAFKRIDYLSFYGIDEYTNTILQTTLWRLAFESEVGEALLLINPNGCEVLAAYYKIYLQLEQKEILEKVVEYIKELSNQKQLLLDNIQQIYGATNIEAEEVSLKEQLWYQLSCQFFYKWKQDNTTMLHFLYQIEAPNDKFIPVSFGFKQGLTFLKEK